MSGREAYLTAIQPTAEAKWNVVDANSTKQFLTSLKITDGLCVSGARASHRRHAFYNIYGP